MSERRTLREITWAVIVEETRPAIDEAIARAIALAPPGTIHAGQQISEMRYKLPSDPTRWRRTHWQIITAAHIARAAELRAEAEAARPRRRRRSPQ